MCIQHLLATALITVLLPTPLGPVIRTEGLRRGCVDLCVWEGVFGDESVWVCEDVRPVRM